MQAGSYVMIDQYINLFLYWGADALVYCDDRRLRWELSQFVAFKT